MVSCVLAFTSAEAEIRAITAIGEYRMGDNDTRIDAKRLALLDAKRLALEQAGTYIESITQIKNFDLTKDEIRAYTAGIVELIEHRTRTTLEGETTVVQVEVTTKIDTDVVAHQIDALHKNETSKTELATLRTELDRLHEELDKKNRELTVKKSKAAVDQVSKERQRILTEESVIDLVSQAIRLGQSNDWVNAIRKYREALAIDSDNTIARFELARALKATGDTDGAIREYRATLRIRPDEVKQLKALGFLLHRDLGMLLEGKRDLLAAVEEYRAASIIMPDNAFAHQLLAYALEEIGDLPGAVAEFREVLRLEPSDSLARHLADLSREASSNVLTPDAAVLTPGRHRLNMEVTMFFEHALRMVEGFKDQERRSYYLALVTGAQAAAGDTHGAFQTMIRIKHKRLKARAARDIAIEQARSVDAQSARETIALLRGDADWALVSRAQALSAIAVALARNGDHAEADRLLQDALKAARSLSLDGRPLDRAEALIAVASAHAESGNADASAKIFREAYEAITLNQSMNDFATHRLVRELWKAEVKAGDVDGARKTVESFGSDSMKEMAYNEIAGAQAAAGNVLDAQKTLKELPANSRYESTLVAVAKAQARKGDASNAAQTLREVMERVRNSNEALVRWLPFAPLADIVEVVVSIWNNKRAIEMLAGIQESLKSLKMDEFDKALIWPCLAKAHAKIGDKPEASKAFQHALEAATRISDPDRQTRAFRVIATAQVRAGDPIAAATTYRQALSAALNIPNENSRLESIEGSVEAVHDVAAREWRTKK